MGFIPKIITAGTTLDIVVSPTAYPAPTWGVSLLLRGQIGIDVVAEPVGTKHRLFARADTSAAWPAGEYWWVLRGSSGDVVETIAEGQITIRPNFETMPDAYDGRSHAKKVLDAVEAVIEGRATRDQQSYTIQGRSLERTPIADLLLLRSKYRAEVQRENTRASGNKSFGRVIKAVMP